MVGSIVFNFLSSQPWNRAPVLMFDGRDASRHTSTIFRTATSTLLSSQEAQREHCIKRNALCEILNKLHPFLDAICKTIDAKAENTRPAEYFAIFTESSFLLMGREEYNSGEQLPWQWHGPRGIIKVFSKIFLRVEDLRYADILDVHASQMIFSKDSCFHVCEIMANVLSSETGTTVARLMGIDDVNIQVWVYISTLAMLFI